jgi:hypothetical protein
VLPLQTIAHHTVRPEIAALRDFGPAYDRCGSFASDRSLRSRDVRFTLIATNFEQWGPDSCTRGQRNGSNAVSGILSTTRNVIVAAAIR